MGYELVYHYHEEISKGEYNKAEIKTKTAKVGTPLDDVPLEAVAGKIIAQLARRNILVVDVEIYEYTKKKISYKESSDGILIKGKKFSFDDGPVVVSRDFNPETEIAENTESVEEQLASLLADPRIKNVLNPPPKPVVKQETLDRPIRHEIYDPMIPALAQDAKQRGMKFTVGKKYPVFAEKKGPNMMAGLIYTVIDDEGKRRDVSERFFNTPTKGVDIDLPKLDNPNKEVDLWANIQKEAMPELRRR